MLVERTEFMGVKVCAILLSIFGIFILISGVLLTFYGIGYFLPFLLRVGEFANKPEGFYHWYGSTYIVGGSVIFLLGSVLCFFGIFNIRVGIGLRRYNSSAWTRSMILMTIYCVTSIFPGINGIYSLFYDFLGYEVPFPQILDILPYLFGPCCLVILIYVYSKREYFKPKMVVK